MHRLFFPKERTSVRSRPTLIDVGEGLIENNLTRRAFQSPAKSRAATRSSQLVKIDLLSSRSGESVDVLCSRSLDTARTDGRNPIRHCLTERDRKDLFRGTRAPQGCEERNPEKQEGQTLPLSETGTRMQVGFAARNTNCKAAHRISLDWRWRLLIADLMEHSH